MTCRRTRDEEQLCVTARVTIQPSTGAWMGKGNTGSEPDAANLIAVHCLGTLGKEGHCQTHLRIHNALSGKGSSLGKLLVAVVVRSE